MADTLTAEALIAELEQKAQTAPTEAARDEVLAWREQIQKYATYLLHGTERRVDYAMGPEGGYWKQVQLPPEYVEDKRRTVEELLAGVTAGELIAEVQRRLKDLQDPAQIKFLIYNTILPGALRSKDFGTSQSSYGDGLTTFVDSPTESSRRSSMPAWRNCTR